MGALMWRARSLFAAAAILAPGFAYWLATDSQLWTRYDDLVPAPWNASAVDRTNFTAGTAYCPGNLPHGANDFDMYCLTNQLGGDIVHTNTSILPDGYSAFLSNITFREDSTFQLGNVDDINSCITICRHMRPACYGTVWDFTTGRCSFKSSDFVYQKDVARHDSNTHLAIPQTPVFQPRNSSCPTDGSVELNNTNFIVTCNHDLIDSDNWDSEPANNLTGCFNNLAYDHVPGRYSHAIWNPDGLLGIENCKLVANSQGMKHVSRRAEDGDGSANRNKTVTHMITLNAPLDSKYDTCFEDVPIQGHRWDADGFFWSDPKSAEFLPKCDRNNHGRVIAQQHNDSILQCIEDCSLRGSACKGVVFDTLYINSNWDENCRLLGKIGEYDFNSTGMITAVRVMPKSKAWIAGPVVGSVVGAALTVAAIWYWRRRRKAAIEAANAHELPPYTTEDPQLPKYVLEEPSLTPPDVQHEVGR